MTESDSIFDNIEDKEQIGLKSVHQIRDKPSIMN